MKPLTHCLLIFIALICLAASCKDDEMPPPEPIDPDGLPLPTQTGENTFGCLINGEPWIAEIGEEIISANLRKLDMLYDETTFGDFYDNKWSMTSKLVNDSTNDIFGFNAKKITEVGEINIENHQLRISYRPSNEAFAVYYVDTLQAFKIEITKLDTLTNICSGTFEFHALSVDQSDTLHITKGRFDKKYTSE